MSVGRAGIPAGASLRKAAHGFERRERTCCLLTHTSTRGLPHDHQRLQRPPWSSRRLRRLRHLQERHQLPQRVRRLPHRPLPRRRLVHSGNCFQHPQRRLGHLHRRFPRPHCSRWHSHRRLPPCCPRSPHQCRPHSPPPPPPRDSPPPRTPP